MIFFARMVQHAEAGQDRVRNSTSPGLTSSNRKEIPGSFFEEKL